MLLVLYQATSEKGLKRTPKRKINVFVLCVLMVLVLLQVTSEKGETSWRRGGARQRPEEWQGVFELCRWCTPEEVKGVKVKKLELLSPRELR